MSELVFDYALFTVNRDGKRLYYTGKAGVEWIGEQRDALRYTEAGAYNKLGHLNKIAEYCHMCPFRVERMI